jgi:periplasmic divalent cation tolerance protein
MNEQFAVVLVTVPDIETGRRLAKIALESRSAACVNLVPGLESHYWWEGKLDTSNEVLMVIKTSRQTLAELEKQIVANHPYETPEFVVLPITHGTERYLKWLAASITG